MTKGDKQQDKQLLFSLTKKDFVMQVFRAGGHGGQKQNKTSSAVRIIHPDSGARGESRRERSQIQNKKLAFQHLTASTVFQNWLKIKTAEIAGDFNGIKEEVDNSMDQKNLKVESKVSGAWVEIK